jgi:alpha-1,6-mannosyltransferase
MAEPHDPASMADAIAALYDRDLEVLGAAARERVLRQFTWHRAFHAQLSVYAALAGTQRLPLPEAEILSLRSPTS